MVAGSSPHGPPANEHDQGRRKSIVVDCANGVGAAKLVALAEAIGPSGWDVLSMDLRNVAGAPGSLNEQVGADFVQKERRAPAHGSFETLGPSERCVSVDGDADRLVYFRKKAAPSESSSESSPDAELFDGDKIAALVATRVTDLLTACAPLNAFDPPLRVGVVQTAYANGASTAYINHVLGVDVKCASTGVKFLHPEATRFDVGVYFEANGHGTAVFSDATIERLDAAIERVQACPDAIEHADAVSALRELKAMTEAINPAVGDALSGILVVEAVLLAKGWGLTEWGNMYQDLPSRQVKVTVRDRSVISVTNAERTAVTPAGMQAAIDEAVGRRGAHARAFARPSGTEDVVRVYAEAATEAGAAELAREVCGIVYDFAGGVGDRP